MDIGHCQVIYILVLMAHSDRKGLAEPEILLIDEAEYLAPSLMMKGKVR